MATPLNVVVVTIPFITATTKVVVTIDVVTIEIFNKSGWLRLY